jgi:CRISPR/Cas system-associated endoribonuclease Cas2
MVGQYVRKDLLMNERIRELYRQANEQARQQACEKNKTNRPQNNTVWNEFVPLFAEMIIKECAKVIDELEDAVVIYRLGGANTGEISKSELVKQHFGVKNE